MDNTVIIIKSLIAMHLYIKKGPIETFSLESYEVSPSQILQKYIIFVKF